MNSPAITTDAAIALHERALESCAAAHWAEAEETARQALAIFESADGPDSPHVANVSNLLSAIAEARSQYASAEAYARRALEIMARLGSRCLGSEADGVRLEARSRLGAALRGAGKYVEAESWLMQALHIAEQSGQGLVQALNNLGLLYECTGNFSAAERLYRRALALVDAGSTEAATLYHNLGGLAHARGRFAESEADARRAWEIHRQLRGEDHPETLADACTHAALVEHLGRCDWPEWIYRHAIARFEEVPGRNHLEIAVSLHNLASMLSARGETAEAEALYRRATAMKEELLGPSHPETALTVHNYASMLADMGRVTEARDLEFGALLVFDADLDSLHPWRAASRQLWERLGRREERAANACTMDPNPQPWQRGGNAPSGPDSIEALV
jgi:tetratricopeptide (TPR) repeat protein